MCLRWLKGKCSRGHTYSAVAQGEPTYVLFPSMCYCQLSTLWLGCECLSSSWYMCVLHIIVWDGVPKNDMQSSRRSFPASHRSTMSLLLYFWNSSLGGWLRQFCLRYHLSNACINPSVEQFKCARSVTPVTKTSNVLWSTNDRLFFVLQKANIPRQCYLLDIMRLVTCIAGDRELFWGRPNVAGRRVDARNQRVSGIFDGTDDRRIVRHLGAKNVRFFNTSRIRYSFYVIVNMIHAHNCFVVPHWMSVSALSIDRATWSCCRNCSCDTR